MADCLFCRIISGELKAHTIYEDPHAFAFLDIHPSSRGHALVIPRAHAETLSQLDDREIGPLFAAVKAVTALLEAALKPAGMNIGVNHGWAAGQRVGHLHVHLIPRYAGDGGSGMQSIVHGFVAEDPAGLAARIRAARPV
jgi:histidine triad (HIT) family protein